MAAFSAIEVIDDDIETADQIASNPPSVESVGHANSEHDPISSSNVSTTSKTSNKTDHDPNSVIRRFFEAAANDQSKIICKVKGCHASYIRAENTVRSNTSWLTKHIQTKHKALYEDAVKLKFSIKKESQAPNNVLNNKPQEHDIFSTNYTFDKSKINFSHLKTVNITFNDHRFQVPLFLVDAFNLICLHVKSEGLFKSPYNTERMKIIRYAFYGDFGLPEYCTMFDICGAIDYFLRSFTQPLISTSQSEAYRSALAENGDETTAILSLLKCSPVPCRAILVYLAVKLRHVSSFCMDNKTSLDVIAQFLVRGLFRLRKKAEADVESKIFVSLIMSIPSVLRIKPETAFCDNLSESTELKSIENDTSDRKPLIIRKSNDEAQATKLTLSLITSNKPVNTCGHCGGCFGSQYDLANHTFRLHPVIFDGTKHICNLCSFVTLQEQVIKDHMRSALHQQRHRNNLATNPSLNSDSVPKQYDLVNTNLNGELESENRVTTENSITSDISSTNSVCSSSNNVDEPKMPKLDMVYNVGSEGTGGEKQDALESRRSSHRAKKPNRLFTEHFV